MMKHGILYRARTLVLSASVLAFALLGFFAVGVKAVTDPASPVGCNADNSVVNIARSTASAHVGQTITFTVSAGNPASGDGCDVANRTMTLTLPNGVTHVFGPMNYPNPTATAFVGSADYVANTADLVSGNWTGSVTWTGTLKDGFDNPSNGSKAVSAVYVADSLQVTKTAVPERTVAYEWSIDKSVTPATWNLFTGDSGTSEYTVAVVKTPGSETQAVSGTITIHNPALVAATVTGVSDAITGFGAVPVNCGVSFPYQLAAGANLICTYTTSLPDTTTRTNTATVTTSGDVLGGADDAAVDFTNVEPTVTNGSVNVDDTNGSSWLFGDSGSVSYTKQFTCDEDSGEHSNTATIRETQQSDSATVTVNCYSLTVGKTAATTYDRTYQWDVRKAVDMTELTLADGETYTVHYTVVATKTGQTDSNWGATGTITVHNPAPMAATITSVSDVISGPVSAAVDCGPATFPYTLASGTDLVCTYSASLPDGASRTNTATATQQHYAYDPELVATPTGTSDTTGSAAVTFGAPANEIDEMVTVTDSYAGVLGTVTVAESPKTFTYSRDIMFTGSEACGDHTVDNTATLVTNDTQTQDSASASVLVHVNCFQGCTLTQGYWKTHSSYGKAPYDDNWAQLASGADTSFFLSTQTWYQVFWTAPKGNAYYNLAHQYMAAKLNLLNGASSTPAVDAAITQAETLFSTYTPAQIAALKGKGGDALRKQFVDLAGTLGSYNEGRIGPGHCDEQVPS